MRGRNKLILVFHRVEVDASTAFSLRGRGINKLISVFHRVEVDASTVCARGKTELILVFHSVEIHAGTKFAIGRTELSRLRIHCWKCDEEKGERNHQRELHDFKFSCHLVQMQINMFLL